jgi:hypothetical protein
MKIQAFTFGLLVVTALLMVPGVRVAAMQRLPDISDDRPACRQVICSERVQSKNSPDIKFRLN